jgi:hypothetical protein
VFLLVKNEKNI